MRSKRKPVNSILLATILLGAFVCAIDARADSGGGSNSHGPTSDVIRGDRAEAMFMLAAYAAEGLPNGDWVTLAKRVPSSDSWTCVLTRKRDRSNNSASPFFCVVGDQRADLYRRAQDEKQGF